MKISYEKTLLAVAFASILVFGGMAPVARALVAGSTGVTGPWDITWDGYIYGNLTAGSSVYLDFHIYDLDLGYSNDTVSALSITTPWATYTAPDMPAQLCGGCDFEYYLFMTIPATQAPGWVNGTLTFSGAYSDGYPFCHDTSNICSYFGEFYVFPDPGKLESQVASLTTSVNALNSQVTSLASQLSRADVNITTLNGEISTYQTQATQLQSEATSLTAKLTAANSSISSYQGQVTSLSNQLGTANQDVSSLNTRLATAQSNETSLQQSLTASNTALQAVKANLASVQSQLTNAQNQLASKQSELNTYSSVYLPVGIVIPVILAVLFAVLYLRKNPKPTATSTV
jgi:chaperonin cofactor prefoldin